jgi:hypothetical protein
MPKTPEQIRLYQAHVGSALATACLQGMKLRAKLNPATAAIGTFPYCHRTCAEWGEAELPQEMSLQERRKDARQGSAKLRDAVRKAAA